MIDVDIPFQKDQEIGKDHKITAGRSDKKLQPCGVESSEREQGEMTRGKAASFDFPFFKKRLPTRGPRLPDVQDCGEPSSISRDWKRVERIEVAIENAIEKERELPREIIFLSG